LTRPGIALPGAVRPEEARELAARAERAGCDAVWVLDVRRDPYLLAAAALEGSETLEIGTNVAVAFARSPTATAVSAWDLQLWGTNPGRFVLGLGSQVGPTLKARFGVEADHPGPRMRDYVAAVRACFSAFQTGFGRHEGPYYNLRRPAFQPGREPGVTPPPVYLAAVNPYMASIAGECADGLAAHPFTTEAYLEEVLRPALARGAARTGRRPPPIVLQLVVAPDREALARQMIAYTVPAYRGVLEHAGLGDVADQVMEASRDGRRSDARQLIESRCLDLLGVALVDELPQAVVRWAPHCDRLSLSVPWFGISEGEQLGAARRLLDRIADLPG
jgi:probable F420-dependent oxidoreductase